MRSGDPGGCRPGAAARDRECAHALARTARGRPAGDRVRSAFGRAPPGLGSVRGSHRLHDLQREPRCGGCSPARGHVLRRRPPDHRRVRRHDPQVRGRWRDGHLGRAGSAGGRCRAGGAGRARSGGRRNQPRGPARSRPPAPGRRSDRRGRGGHSRRRRGNGSGRRGEHGGAAAVDRGAGHRARRRRHPAGERACDRLPGRRDPPGQGQVDPGSGVAPDADRGHRRRCRAAATRTSPRGAGRGARRPPGSARPRARNGRRIDARLGRRRGRARQVPSWLGAREVCRRSGSDRALASRASFELRAGGRLQGARRHGPDAGQDHARGFSGHRADEARRAAGRRVRRRCRGTRPCRASAEPPAGTR